ncbi:MAG: B12-binding domain-containing radical SAM protein [Candidatus Bilamarchaeaceae archaeon]
MKVLFVVPPFPARTYPGKTMGPDYLAGALVNHGNIPPENIEILDLDVLGLNILNKKLKSTDYDLVGISFLSFQTNEAMKIAEIADRIIKTKGRRDAKKQDYVPIIVGGHGTSKSDCIIPLYPEVDAWVIGEGLETILDIANSTLKGTFLEDRKNIPGLKYFDGKEVITTSSRKLVDRLDDFLPLRLNHYPEYDFDVFDYKKTAQVMTQIGCAGSCVYCHESTARKNIRQRSIASIKKEIEELISQGYRAVYFDDSTFTWDKKRTLEIIELMKTFNQKYGIVWGFNTRVDCLDKELIEKIKDSGCTYMFAGVESLVPEVLAGINKVRGFTPSKDYQWYQNGKTEEEYIYATKEVFKWMSEAGIKRSAFLIFGGPTLAYETADGKGKFVRGVETFEQAKKTIDQAVWELNPEYISINIMRFIPNALMSFSPVFSKLRGQNEEYHAGYFSKRWKEQNNFRNDVKRSHPIYLAFEAAQEDYPIPPHMTPDYCYSILKYLVEQVNEKTKKTKKETQIVVDKKFKKYLTKDENGIYHLAPFAEMNSTKFNISELVIKLRTLIKRIKSSITLALAKVTSLGTGIEGWINIKTKENDNLNDLELTEDRKLMADVEMNMKMDSTKDKIGSTHREFENTIYCDKNTLFTLVKESKEFINKLKRLKEKSRIHLQSQCTSIKVKIKKE